MTKNNKRKTEFKRNERVTHKAEKATDLECFNCGTNEHKSANCRYKSRGTKCFQCDKFGHIVKNCPLYSSSITYSGTYSG